MNLRIGRLAVAVVLASAVAGLNAAPPTAPVRVVARVNGEPVTEAEVEQDLAMVIKSRFKLQAPTEAQRRELRVEVMHVLIDEALMRQFLEKTGIQVSPPEVEKKLAEVEAHLRKETPPRTLQEYCKETGQTESQVRAGIANVIRWTAYVNAHVKEEDVKRYYDENKEFFDQVMVAASHILIRVAPGASEGERQAARQKLQALRADITAGKIDFAEAARKHSQCSSAPNGGDLGYFSRKWMQPEPIAQAAFALPVGGVSDVLQTPVGLHLVKVTDRKNGEPSEYAKVKDEARLYYVEEIRQELLLKERKAAKIEITP